MLLLKNRHFLKKYQFLSIKEEKDIKDIKDPESDKLYLELIKLFMNQVRINYQEQFHWFEKNLREREKKKRENN